jgi:hypothetical protein
MVGSFGAEISERNDTFTTEIELKFGKYDIYPFVSLGYPIPSFVK